MDKWEYTIRNFQSKLFAFAEIDEKLEIMGKVGWELAGVYKNYFIFKRKIKS